MRERWCWHEQSWWLWSNGPIASPISKHTVDLTWCRIVLQQVVVAHRPNASSEHDRFNPFATFSASRQHHSKWSGKSSNDRLAELVAVVWRTIAGVNSDSEWTCQVRRILKTCIFPRQNIIYNDNNATAQHRCIWIFLTSTPQHNNQNCL